MNIRSIIMDAVRSKGRMTMADIREVVNRSASTPQTKASVGQVVRHLIDAGKLHRDGEYIIPVNGQMIVQANSENEKKQLLAPFQSQRSAKVVTIEQSPIEIEDAARVQLNINEQWVTIPLFNSIRICTGPDVPRWNPAQETYYHVRAIRVITKSGKSSDMNLDPRNPLTIAPA